MFASPADLGEFKYVTRTSKNLSETGYARSRRIPAGSTLFVCIGSTIGKVGLAKEDMTANQQINAVIPGPTVDCEYLYYASTTLSAKVRSLAGEQAVPLMNKSAFSEFEIPFPPMPEQRAIASALADADELIATLERLIGKKQAIRQGIMQQLLTGKTRLLGFAEPWVKRPFSEVMARVNAKRHQIPASTYREVGRLPVVDQGKESIVGYTDRTSAAMSPGLAGVIVFGDHTCITKFVDFDFAVGADGTQVLRAAPGVSARFVSYVLELDPVASTGYNRHFKFLREKTLLLPPIHEQNAVAEVIRDFDDEIIATEARLAKAKAVKQGMVQQLLSGRTRLAIEEGVT